MKGEGVVVAVTHEPGPHRRPGASAHIRENRRLVVGGGSAPHALPDMPSGGTTIAHSAFFGPNPSLGLHHPSGAGFSRVWLMVPPRAGGGTLCRRFDMFNKRKGQRRA